MKVKEIVYEDGPIPGQGTPGKITKVNPAQGDKPGSVDVTMPNGVTSEIPSNMITKGPDGKPTANTQTSNTSSAVSPDQQIQPGQDLKVQEEPVPRQIPKVSIANPLRPMVMDNGNIKGTPLEKASGDITPELIARSAPDFEERYIEANGKKYLALATGTVFKVSPRDFSEITGLSHLPGNTNQKYAPAQHMPYNTNNPRPSQFQKLEESAEVSRIKLLSGL